jgi:NitT/TauT family transport system ATP-binding protein
VIVDWGRYAEIFAYDYEAGIFSTENPGAEVET